MAKKPTIAELRYAAEVALESGDRWKYALLRLAIADRQNTSGPRSAMTREGLA